MTLQAPPTVATLTVQTAQPADAGRRLARLAEADMERLDLRPGDVVALCSVGDPPGPSVHARAMPAPMGSLAAGAIALDRDICERLAVRPGATLALSLAPLPEAIRVAFAGPAAPPTEMVRGHVMEWPLSLEERIVVPTPGLQPIVLSVTDIDPSPAARIVPSTAIEFDPPSTHGFAGVGGLGREIKALREIVDLPRRHPGLFESLGIDPPRGVLFTGPPGSGKTLLARALADETDAAFFQVDAPEIVAKHYGDSEAQLRGVFNKATAAAPAIVFIDEIDAIAAKRDAMSGEKQLERRIVAQLLTLLDGLGARGDVIVLAATNLPDSLDPALRRPGRFDREIAFQPPDAAARADILTVLLGAARLGDDVDLSALAARTHGYVGADLAALVREAALAAVTRLTGRGGGGVDPAITAGDLEAGLAKTAPSALRETAQDTAPVRWADIGGLEVIKADLVEAVLWPLRHPEAHRALRLRPPSGLLLAGPPGSGKTLLARALATESGVNFIPVRAARLLSPYLGEAERAIADVFARARHAQPAILFMDEVDALAPGRGSSEPALQRVVAQLLVEIDGLEETRGVFLLGATNRPDGIDPALLRPGRFDRVVEIGLPDAAARAAILDVHLRGRPLAGDLDAAEMARETEGWSGAALAALVDSAARAALRRSLAGQSEAAPHITPEDMRSALAMRADGWGMP